MNTKTVLTTAAIFVGGFILFDARNQEPARAQKSGGGAASGIGSGGTSFRVVGGRVSSAESTRRKKMRDAIKLLRTAKTTVAKDKAKNDLSALLKDQFDADLKRREKEIADIEARVKDLRSVLDKRRTARDNIIQLQIKVLVNEAEGLGFPGGNSTTNDPYGQFRNRFVGRRSGYSSSTTGGNSRGRSR